MSVANKKKRKFLNAAEVVARIRTKYGDETKGWTVFEQVASGTGAMRLRFADVVAMNLWPSKGLEIVGFEVKTSRADWGRELRNRGKVEDGVYQFCDRWYVVAGALDIVDLDELPKSWGLLEPYGAGLKVAKIAPQLEPSDVDRLFVAAVLRRASKASSCTSLDKLRAANRRGFEDGKSIERESVKHDLERLRLIRDRTKVFEKASGLSIEWGGDVEELGRVVRAIREGRLDVALNRVRSVEATVVELAERLTLKRKEIEKALLDPVGVPGE